MKKVIKIAGAGVSGLTSAINLIDRGYDVEIYEKKDVIAHRFIGDFQGIENWTTKEDALELIKTYNLKINFNTTPSNNFSVVGPQKNLKDFSSEKNFYYLIQRGNQQGNLDYGLYQQAIEKNVKIIFNCEKLPDDINIIATGPSRASAVILGYNFKTDYQNTHLMLCDNDLAPKGYAYLLVVDGCGTIATAFMPDKNNPNSYLEKTVDAVQKIYNLNIVDKKKFGTYGSFSSPNIYKEGNKLYLGEAAGLQDFLFGFGLRYAMLSGYLAAKCIDENLDYKKIAEETFSGSIKASLVNRFLYEKLDNNKYDFMINRLGHVKDLNNFLGTKYNFDLKRKLLYPFAKIKYTNKK